MSINASCPSCGKNLRMRDELNGKKVKCPACETVFLAPTSGAEDSVQPGYPKPRAASAAQNEVSARPIARKFAPPEDEDDEAEERPARSRLQRKEFREGASEFLPCPQCASTHAQKVGFTWWGGVLGPWMLTHVKCQECHATFNGKTGKSNANAIALYVLVSLVIVLGLLLVGVLG